MGKSAEQVEHDVRGWVDRIVVKLGLCPFAAPVIEAEGLKIVVTETTDEDEAMAAVLHEIRALIESQAEEVDTTMIVVPNQLGDFELYLEILAELEGVLEEAAKHFPQKSHGWGAKPHLPRTQGGWGSEAPPQLRRGANIL